MGCLSEVYNCVKVFHQTFNHPAPEKPVERLEDKRKEVRSSWMQEELDEYLLADNIYDEMDALCDLIYFAVGTAVELGIDPSDVFGAIQRANMSKLWPDGKPHYNEFNKVIKPKGWEPPDKEIRKYIDKALNKS